MDEKRAFDLISQVMESRTTVVTLDLANRLLATWRDILDRTQYLNEVLDGPNRKGSRIIVADGVSYHFRYESRSGGTRNPRQGSLLYEFVQFIEELRNFISSPKEQMSAKAKQLHVELDHLQARIKENQPCLRAEPL